MLALSRILFPVDFSNRCRGTAHAVSALAQRYTAEVTLLHVVEAAQAEGGPADALKQARLDTEKLIHDEFTSCNVTPYVTTGDPAVTIIEQAHAGHFDVIMMPTHGYGPFRKFLLGSVTAKVLHDAHCPVWTSTHLEDWPPVKTVSLRNILCGVDFGSRSEVALRCAAQVTREFKANLVVAHAIPLFDTLPSPPAWEDQTAKAEKRVQGMETAVGLSASIEILEGRPASALSEAVERLDADLIIIGRTHVADELAKLGSNAYSIIGRSPCPVLSV